MDRDMIYEKLESLQRCIKRLEERRPSSLDMLKDDVDVQDILTLNITRAIQVSVDIGMHIIAAQGLERTETMAEVFVRLEDYGIIGEGLSTNLQRSVGFRNVAIHEYQAIDWQIVFAICHDHINHYEEYARAIVAWMETNKTN